MIATHNIKVNGRWYRAGEEYAVEEPQVTEQAAVEQEEPVAAPSEEPKVAPKPRPATTRRKTSK